MCSACGEATTVEEAVPPSGHLGCEACGREQTWQYDRRTQTGAWVCFPFCAAAAARQTQPTSTTAFSWAASTAPRSLVVGNLNSWLYVPVLLDAAGRLDPWACQTWRQHPVAGRWWQVLQNFLREAQPVEARTVVNAIRAQAPYSHSL